MLRRKKIRKLNSPWFDKINTDRRVELNCALFDVEPGAARWNRKVLARWVKQPAPKYLKGELRLHADSSQQWQQKRHYKITLKFQQQIVFLTYEIKSHCFMCRGTSPLTFCFDLIVDIVNCAKAPSRMFAECRMICLLKFLPKDALWSSMKITFVVALNVVDATFSSCYERVFFFFWA